MLHVANWTSSDRTCPQISVMLEQEAFALNTVQGTGVSASSIDLVNKRTGVLHESPWRVMPFEALDEPSRLGGGKGRVERCRGVGREVVLHQHDLGRVREMGVGQFLDGVGIVDGGVAVGDLDAAPASLPAARTS
jgi:hypothetical protein